MIHISFIPLFQGLRGLLEEAESIDRTSFSASLSKPDNWGVTKGSKELQQHKANTSDDEIESLRAKRTDSNGH